MIDNVTAPPFNSLNETQKLIVRALRGSSKTPKQLEIETQRNYHPIIRALNELKNKNWVEVDPLLSGGKSNAWRLRQVPSDGIELVIDTATDQESISFNRYIETLARQLNGGRRPKLEREAENYCKSVAALGYYAAKEYLIEGSVSEAELLEVRSAVQRFVITLQEAYSIGNQILNDERFWHADMLANGVVRKTDRHLTPAQLAEYAKMITAAFEPTSTEVSDTENETEEEEQDSAEDYA